MSNRPSSCPAIPLTRLIMGDLIKLSVTQFPYICMADTLLPAPQGCCEEEEVCNIRKSWRQLGVEVTIRVQVWVSSYDSIGEVFLGGISFYSISCFFKQENGKLLALCVYDINYLLSFYEHLRGNKSSIRKYIIKRKMCWDKVMPSVVQNGRLASVQVPHRRVCV